MQNGAFKYAPVFLDYVAILVSFRFAFFLRYEAGLFPPEPAVLGFSSYHPALAMAIGIWTLIFLAFELDQVSLVQDLPVFVSQFLATWMFLFVLLLGGSYLAKMYYSRLLLVFLALSLLVFLLLGRFLQQGLVGWLKKHGIGVRRVIIVGQSGLARELAERIRQHPELHYEFGGFLLPIKTQKMITPSDCSVGSSEQIVQELVSQNFSELIFTVPIRRDTEVLEFIASCQKQGIAVKSVPEYYDLHTSQIERVSIDGIPLLEFRGISPRPSQRVLKRLMDLLVASIGLIAFLPAGVLAAIAWAIALKGRVFKRELRIGLEGRPFVMYRFDVSLAENPNVSVEQGWKLRILKFLHRYSFSELPQLWNVLKGDMSIVGPRPETPDRVRHYSAWHRRRLQLKPGITGLAQVKGLRGFDSSDLKTRYDLEYAAKFSFRLDVALMLATVYTLLGRTQILAGTRQSLATAPCAEPLRTKLSQDSTGG